MLFGEVESQVRTVLVAGERVFDEGRSTRVDERDLMEHCRERARALWGRFQRAKPRWKDVLLQEEP